MKLTDVRVQNYKSIEDSETFSIGDLTCLAGKNESGKTAVLQALRRLNPVEESEAKFNHTMEFPRSRINEAGAEGESAEVLTTTWELSPDDVAAVEAQIGTGGLTSRQITISKGYRSGRQTWTIPIDEPRIIKRLADSVDDLTEVARTRVAKQTSVTGLHASTSALGDKATVGEKKLVELFGAFRDGRPALTAMDVLADRVPKFLYFDTYGAMPGRIGVEALIASLGADEDLEEGERIFLALLELAGTSMEEVRDAQLSEALIAKLEGVSNRITKAIFKYWSQNRHLKVRFDYREALPEDPEAGHVFLTRVENQRHGVTVGFDERSAGFVWFFSFLVWFSQMESEFGDKLVILLDEPGLSLHGKAQGDLLRYIKEQLLPKYQVVYSTHSPFMIDAADLFTVRTVEDKVSPDDDILGTKVGDEILSTDADTIFPLRAVLGYDITQTLFVGEHTLLVEGPSDLLYLTWASHELLSRGRTRLDPRWVITPTGGIDKIASFIALFGGNKLHVAVLTDFHSGDKKKVNSLRDLTILRAGHVFSADQYAGAAEADIEDILGRDFYAGLVNAAYGLTGTSTLPATKPKAAPDLVLAEVQAKLDVAPAAGPAIRPLPSRRVPSSELGHASDLVA